jgi:hypothetical protein
MRRTARTVAQSPTSPRPDVRRRDGAGTSKRSRRRREQYASRYRDGKQEKGMARDAMTEMMQLMDGDLNLQKTAYTMRPRWWESTSALAYQTVAVTASAAAG